MGTKNGDQKMGTVLFFLNSHQWKLRVQRKNRTVPYKSPIKDRFDIKIFLVYKTCVFPMNKGKKSFRSRRSYENI